MMSVLFVSHSKQQARFFNDPSARYRCIFPAEYLNQLGCSAFVEHVDFVTQSQIQTVDVVVFHRPSFTSRFHTVLTWAKRSGKRCLADYDDLLFAPDQSVNSAAVKSGAMSVKAASGYAQEYLKALNQFDECIVSTHPLAQWVANVSDVSRVKVIPNRLPQRWYAQADNVPLEVRFRQKVLRYLPGTSHHDGDFDFIKLFLTEFLNTHADVTLEIIGPLRFDLPEVNGQQVRHAGAVPFDRLATLMADSWVCIAPLLDTSFNQCKSGLKFWESGLYGVPLVASPLADFDDFKCEGLIEVSSEQEWVTALESFLDWDRYQIASTAAAKSAQRVLHGSEPNLYLELLADDSLRQVHEERGRNVRNEWINKKLSASSGEMSLVGNKTEFYRVQQQYFHAWLGPGWMANLLKSNIDLNESMMPGEVANKAEQFAMLQRGGKLPERLELPESYDPYMKEHYDSWGEWIDDASRANQALWQTQKQPAGSPFVRKWRKFRRSPKHFFEDAKSPWLKTFAKLFS